MTTLKLTWSLVLTGVLVTAACGDSKSSMLPTAPSAVGAATQSEEAGDPDAVSSTTGKGDKGKDKDKDKDKNKNGNGNGNGNGNQPSVPTPPTVPGNTTPPTNTTPPVPSTKKVELEGLISAKGSNTITVNGQLVSVPPSAVIRHGSKTFKFSDLRVGNRVHVKATRMASTATGASAATTLVASEVKLQNARDDDDEDDDEDDDDPSASQLVSVAASDATASETGPDSGTFRLTRSGNLSASLTVTFTLEGTATNGIDYDPVTLSVTFTAGSSTATVSVVPKPDSTVEGPETVILTVVDGVGYTAGAPATATVTIAG